MASKKNSTGSKSKLQSAFSSKKDIGQVRTNNADKTNKVDASPVKSMIKAFNDMPLYGKAAVFIVATKDHRLKKKSEKLMHDRDSISDQMQSVKQGSVEFYMLQAEQRNLRERERKLQKAKQNHDKVHRAMGTVFQNLGMNFRMQANRPVAQAEGDTSGTQHGITYSSRANAARTMDIIDSTVNSQPTGPSM